MRTCVEIIKIFFSLLVDRIFEGCDSSVNWNFAKEETIYITTQHPGEELT